MHIIVGLDAGGAELALRRLVDSNPGNIPDTVVVSLTSLGVVGELLRANSVGVHTLGITGFLHLPGALWQLLRLVRRYRPAIVQTWMYHADFLGGLAARLAGSCAVVWGIRSTNIPQGRLSVTYWLIRLCAILSHIIPHRIICNSNSAKAAHLMLGYPAEKMTVIYNGYEFAAFERHLNSRDEARATLGLGRQDIVVGVVGRFDPLKDFQNFINAAATVARKVDKVKFLMVGRHLDLSNDTLRGWIEVADLKSRFILVGAQIDVPFYLSAMDIFCLSSQSEAFPNVVVEAMAMSLPCVVTRAGDAAEIVGEDGFVVPVKDSISLAGALLKMYDLDLLARRKLGERGARRVRADYGIERMRQSYEDTYRHVVCG